MLNISHFFFGFVSYNFDKNVYLGIASEGAIGEEAMKCWNFVLVCNDITRLVY